MKKSNNNDLSELKEEISKFRDTLDSTSISLSQNSTQDSDSSLKLATSFSPLHDLTNNYNTDTYSTQRQTLKTLKFSDSNSENEESESENGNDSFMHVSELLSDSDTEEEEDYISKKITNKKVTIVEPKGTKTPKTKPSSEDDLEDVISPASFHPRATNKSLLDNDSDMLSPIKGVSPILKKEKKRVSILDDGSDDEVVLPRFEVTNDDKYVITRSSIMSPEVNKTEIQINNEDEETKEIGTPIHVRSTTADDPIEEISLYKDIYSGIDKEEVEKEVKKELEEKKIITNDYISKLFKNLPDVETKSSDDDDIEELLAFKPPVADYVPEYDLLNGLSKIENSSDNDNDEQKQNAHEEDVKYHQEEMEEEEKVIQQHEQDEELTEIKIDETQNDEEDDMISSSSTIELDEKSESDDHNVEDNVDSSSNSDNEPDENQKGEENIEQPHIDNNRSNNVKSDEITEKQDITNESDDILNSDGLKDLNLDDIDGEDIDLDEIDNMLNNIQKQISF